MAELGPMEVSAEQEKSFPIHPVFGVIVLVGGVALILLDGRGKSN